MTTKLAAVIGWPIAHSKSPAIVNAAFAELGIDARMDAWAIAPEKLAAAITELRERRALGASVTVPHKEAIVGLCDELSADARAIGAVNCVALDGAKLVGHNTDAPGFRAALEAAKVDSRFAVLLGAGGAARAVRHALSGHVEVVARRAHNWTPSLPWTKAQLRTVFARADLVVDCTPAGLDPDVDVPFADFLPLDRLPSSACVATLIYHRDTHLLARARDRGLRTLDGRAMLVHQAALAIALWTQRAAPIAVMTRALDDALRE